MSWISEQAIVETVGIGAGVRIAEFSVIRAGVTIGDAVVIHPHVVIESGVTIGDNVEIFPGAYIGNWSVNACADIRGTDRNRGQLLYRATRGRLLRCRGWRINLAGRRGVDS